MQRTGLNRHRRGYATKEAVRDVHFPVSGPIGLARSQFLITNFITIVITSLSVNSFKSRYSQVSEALDFYRVYSTSMAYDPIILVIRDIQGIGKTILPHASRYQSNPINLHK